LSKSPTILIVDNFDSFTFNIFHYIEPIVKHADVVRYDKLKFEEIKNYDGILFSPGPLLPKNYIKLNDIINEFENSKPILGICLGHQLIAEHYGAMLYNMNEVWHGVEKNTELLTNDKLFKGLPKIIKTGHYHSWAVSDNNIPKNLIITAKETSGVIMGISHKKFNVKGIQFHPESILTPLGFKIIENWVNSF